MSRSILLSLAVLFTAFLSSCGGDAPQASELSAETKTMAEDLLVRWADALLELKIEEGEEAGNYICPACPDGHGRVIDMVWPMTWLWQRTGEEKYLDAARDAVAWGDKHLQQPDGSYKNDYKSNWRGITEFSQIALGKTLLRFGTVLPQDLAEAWRDLFVRQTEYIIWWIGQPKGTLNVNYQAARPLCMELAYRITGEQRFRDCALEQAEKIVAHIAPDGLLFGESHPSDYLSPRGLRGVDMGYNVEESLPLLLEYAEMVGDSRLLETLVESADAHLSFILPDGGLDNSFGTRSNKWTYWGSRTSDGIMPMLSALARNGHPEALRAAKYTLGLYERCTDADGLLAGGLYYGEADEPSCIHHAFCHIKPLPDWIDSDFSALDGTACPPILSETAFGVRHFESRDVYLLGTREWRATVDNADNWFNRESQTTAGGSLSLLYHRKAGIVFAGTSMVFHDDEAHNMQWQQHDTLTRCFTPRLDDGEFSNVYDKDAKVEVIAKKHGIEATVSGTLTDAKGAKGAPFSISYSLCRNRLMIEASGSGNLILPVICTPDDAIETSGDSKMSISRGGATVSISATTELIPARTARPDGFAFNPIAGLMSPYLTVPLTDGKASVTITVR